MNFIIFYPYKEILCLSWSKSTREKYCPFFFLHIRQIVEWFDLVPSLSHVRAPEGLYFKMTAIIKRSARVWADWQASRIWPIWNNWRSFLIYLKKLKKSIKSYFDSKEVKSDWLLLACYTVMSSFQSCYFLNCSSHYVDSEILSCIFAPCLVYGFRIALNVYVSHHFYLSSVQVSVFVKESYIHFQRPFIFGLGWWKKGRRLVL